MKFDVTERLCFMGW